MSNSAASPSPRRRAIAYGVKFSPPVRSCEPSSWQKRANRSGGHAHAAELGVAALVAVLAGRREAFVGVVRLAEVRPHGHVAAGRDHEIVHLVVVAIVPVLRHREQERARLRPLPRRAPRARADVLEGVRPPLRLGRHDASSCRRLLSTHDSASDTMCELTGRRAARRDRGLPHPRSATGGYRCRPRATRRPPCGARCGSGCRSRPSAARRGRCRTRRSSR